jgi:hypothetical protein
MANLAHFLRVAARGRRNRDRAGGSRAPVPLTVPFNRDASSILPLRRHSLHPLGTSDSSNRSKNHSLSFLKYLALDMAGHYNSPLSK